MCDKVNGWLVPDTDKACRELIARNFVLLAKEKFGLSEASLHSESRRARASKKRRARGRATGSAASAGLHSTESLSSTPPSLAALTYSRGAGEGSATGASERTRTASSGARARGSSLLSDLPGIERLDELSSDEEEELDEDEEDGEEGLEEEEDEEADDTAEVVATARRELPKRLSKLVLINNDSVFNQITCKFVQLYYVHML